MSRNCINHVFNIIHAFSLSKNVYISIQNFAEYIIYLHKLSHFEHEHPYIPSMNTLFFLNKTRKIILICKKSTVMDDFLFQVFLFLMPFNLK